MTVVRRGVLALLLTTTLLTPAPAQAAPCGLAAAVKAGRWYAASPPRPAHSATWQAVHGDLRRLRAVAVDPAGTRAVLATDGERVQRSDDGGCTWRQVWALPDTGTGPSRDLDAITSLDIGPHGRVLLTVEPTGYGPRVGGLTTVYRSPDGRTGWTAAGDPATFATVDDQIGVSPSPVVHGGAGGVAYVAYVAAGTVAYARSTDGGATWERRSPAAAPTDPVSFTGFAVSPWNPDDLWEWGGSMSQARQPLPGLRHSTDGARTWTSVDPWPFLRPNVPIWHSVDVAWPRRGAPARLLAVGGMPDPASNDPPPVASWSGDGGRTFTQVLPPMRASLADAVLVRTAAGDTILATATGETYRIRCARRVPGAGDWRALPRGPVADSEWTGMGYDRARATATSPGVVALPTWTTVALLAVAS